MVGAVCLQQFEIPRMIRHVHFITKQRRASRQDLQRLGKRAFEAKQRAPTATPIYTISSAAVASW